MSTQPQLGQLLTQDEPRDAVHVAIAGVLASEILYPGQHVGFVGPGRDGMGTIATTHIGIVDPFLKTAVYPGQRFWLFLYPQTITALRHDWTHPAFEDVSATISQPTHKDKSEAWLRALADSIDITYNGLMTAADQWIQFEEHTVQHGSETWRNGRPKDMAEFWHHYEIVTGERPKDAERWFFCCAC